MLLVTNWANWISVFSITVVILSRKNKICRIISKFCPCTSTNVLGELNADSCTMGEGANLRMCVLTSPSVTWHRREAPPPAPGFSKGSRCAAAVNQEAPTHPRHPAYLLCTLPDNLRQVRMSPEPSDTVFPVTLNKCHRLWKDLKFNRWWCSASTKLTVSFSQLALNEF